MLNLLDALYLDWYQTGPLRERFFEVRHLPCPNPQDKAFPRFYRQASRISQWYDHHLIFGVNPRAEFRNSRKVSHVVALYADVEYSPTGLYRIQSFEPRPSAVVCSGKGWHTYWFLDQPVAVTPELETTVPLMLRGIVAELKSDPAVVSLGQTLRMPGSWNLKYPAPCRELSVDAAIRYDLDEFAPFAEIARREQPCLSGESSAGKYGSVELPDLHNPAVPPRLQQDVQSSVKLAALWSNQILPQYPSGSERDFALALTLVWRSYRDEQIAAVLLLAPYPKRMARTPHYLCKTIHDAKQAVVRARGTNRAS